MNVEEAVVMHSKPVYPTVLSLLGAGRRLLVIQDASLAEAARLHEQLSADGQPLELASLHGEAAWTGEQVSCGAFALLEVRLLSLLSSAPVGSRLYVCGDESFLWQVSRLARESGLLDEEIERIKVGSAREVYCVHCATQQCIGTETTVICSGCGVQLMVREHFSRRLGAYMGVCLDAQRPHGEGRP